MEDSRMSNSLPIMKHKLVFLGDQSVGKTSIINRFMFDIFEGKDHPTVGIDFVSKNLNYNDRIIRLQIWDTAGQERFRSLIPSYIRDSSAAIIVFDLSEPKTFESIDKWVEDVKNNRGNDALIFLVANKEDKDDKYSRQKGKQPNSNSKKNLYNQK